MGFGMKMGIGFALSLTLILVDSLLLIFTDMSMLLFWVIFAVSMVLLIVPLLFIKGASVTLEFDSLSISAPFVDLKIPYNTIQAVEFRETFRPGMRTYGMNMIRKASGNFTNEEFGHYKFTGYRSVEGYVVVRYGGDKTVVFNYGDRDNTYALYTSLLSRSKANDTVASLPGIEEKVMHDRKVNRIIVISLIAFVAITLAIAIGVVCFAGHVDATLNADNLHVGAIMVDETIQYTDISSVELRDGFDYGSRRAGFGGLGYQTGRYNNAEFGNYLLAVHSDVNKTIVVTYGSGQHLAFNLGSNDDTTAFYTDLSGRI